MFTEDVCMIFFALAVLSFFVYYFLSLLSLVINLIHFLLTPSFCTSTLYLLT